MSMLTDVRSGIGYGIHRLHKNLNVTPANTGEIKSARFFVSKTASELQRAGSPLIFISRASPSLKPTRRRGEFPTPQYLILTTPRADQHT